MKKIFLLLSLISVIFITESANAKKGMIFGKFGEQVEIHKLQDISLKGPNKEKLFLGHVVKTQYFLLGLYMEDAGYALGIENSDSYYNFPNEDKVKYFQSKNLLPNPLPKYKIKLTDYLIGYSLLIAFIILIIWAIIYSKIKNRNKNHAINQKTEPHENLKLAAKGITKNLIDDIRAKNNGKVHPESLITSISALAGFACQMAIREELIKKNKITEEQAFVKTITDDGNILYSGDLLNELLFTSPLSIYNINLASSKSLNIQNIPDPNEIISHVSESIGKKDYGITRAIDGSNQAMDLPINYVKTYWKEFYPILENVCMSSAEWVMLLAYAIQRIINLGKNALAPETAFKIAMETAVSMSKIDYKKVS